MGVDHRDLPDGARPAERQLSARRHARRTAGRRPPCRPGFRDTRCRGSPGTCSAAQRRSSGRPFITSSTTGVPVADDRLQQLELVARVARGEDRDAASPIMFCHSPTHHDRDVGGAGRARRLGRTRRRRRSRPGRPGALPPNMSNIDGNTRCAGRTPGAYSTRTRSPARAPDAVAARSRSRPGRSRSTHGPMVSRGESASGPITATEPQRSGSSGSRSPSLRNNTADRWRPSGPPCGAPGRRAPAGPGPRRRTACRTGPSRAWRSAPDVRSRRRQPR